MLGRLFKRGTPGKSEDAAPLEEETESVVRPKEAESIPDHQKIDIWLSQLPEQYRPYRMTDVYPRIALKMSSVWDEPVLMQKYFRDLVIDDRGDRQGFPEDVAVEIFRLIRYFEDRVEKSVLLAPSEVGDER